jgi:hypothetical protein
VGSSSSKKARLLRQRHRDFEKALRGPPARIYVQDLSILGQKRFLMQSRGFAQ